MSHRRSRRAFTTLARCATYASGAGLAALLAGSTAWAQNAIPASNGAGLDTHLFRPAMDSKGLFTVNGSDILGKNDISFGLVIDYAHDLLRLAGGTSTGQLIDHSFQGTFQFNYGLLNMFVVGIDLPIDLMSGQQQLAGPYAAGNLWGPQQLNFQGLSYVAAHAKWRITKVEHGFGLALGLQIGDGLSDPAQNGGAEPGFFYWPSAIVEKRFGPRGEFRIAANAGYRGHSASSTQLPIYDPGQPNNLGKYTDGSLFTYGGGISIRVLEPLDLVGETYGTYLVGASGATSGVLPSNEAVGGIKLFVERNSYLMLGGGTRYTNGLRGRRRPRLHRLHLRAVHRRSRRRRHQGRRRQVPRRSRGLRRLRGRRRLPRSRQRQRRHPRRRRPLPERARGPRRLPGRGRLPRRQRRRSRRRRHPRLARTSAPTIPRTTTASRTRTAAPIRTTTRTASPTSRIAARTIRRTRTASRTRTAAPIPTTTRTASPT